MGLLDIADEAIVNESGRPNFAAFSDALEVEAKWVADLNDVTGQSASDAATLRRLRRHVMLVAKKLGYDVHR